MHPIVTDADLDRLFAAPLAVLYKHSPICPTAVDHLAGQDGSEGE